MDKQEIFDAVRKYANTMNEKSLDEDGTCVYRSDNGNSCFIGAFIPDNLYDPEMEGHAILGLGIYKGVIESLGIPKYDNDNIFKLWADLQDVHDDWDIFTWEDGFKEVAEKHNLIMDK